MSQILVETREKTAQFWDILFSKLRKWQYEDYFPRERSVDSYKQIRESLKIRAKSIGVHSPMTLEDENALLLNDAILLAKINDRITLSLLQRRLRIGYTKSVQLIEKMEKAGLIKKSKEDYLSWSLVVK
jgi:DNA segregation ATPase FtsK/SpoIIIE-like protein